MSRSDRSEPRTLRRLAAGMGTLGVAVSAGVVAPAASEPNGAVTSAERAPAARPEVAGRPEHLARAAGWGSTAARAEAAAVAASPCDTDARTVHSAAIRKTAGGQEIGTVLLQYSPGCRKVRSVAFTYESYPACVRNASRYDFCVNAIVNHDHTEPPYWGILCGMHTHQRSFSVNGGRKSVTEWVDDRGIIQNACADVRYGGGNLAWGGTDPY